VTSRDAPPPPEAIVFRVVGTLLLEPPPGPDAARATLAPAPGAHDLLDELAADQVPLAGLVAADREPRDLAALLERHGLRRALPVLVGADGDTVSGSDGEGLARALRRLGAARERTWRVTAGEAHPGGVSIALGEASAGHRELPDLTALLALYLESWRGPGAAAMRYPGRGGAGA
jgi:hypothetical protein